VSLLLSKLSRGRQPPVGETNLLRPVATAARALDSASISALQHGLESKPDNVAHKLTACCVTGLTRRVVVESDDSQLNNKKKAS
jgi:hypothetical protein